MLTIPLPGHSLGILMTAYMRVLIAFDKFKECMSAQVACATLQEALQEAMPGAEAISAPICDGGEGFCETLCSARDGRFVELDAQGPRGEPRRATIGLVDASKLDHELRGQLGCDASHGELAVVEMAQASGLWGLPAELRNPHKATSRGTGQMLAAAADAGAGAILLGIGGSASSDLGLGALEALGLRFHDRAGRELCGICPERWDDVYTIGGKLRPLPPLSVACDVRNPLLGPNGAAAIFGPQKGLAPADVPAFDARARRIAMLLCEHFARPPSLLDEEGAGAAGGMGWGLRVAYGARYLPGFELTWRWMGFEEKLRRADILVTGEGSFDSASLGGKGPGTLLKMALEAGLKVLVLAGRVEPGLEIVAAAGKGRLKCVSISPPELPLDEALRRGPELLRAAFVREIDRIAAK